jgi:hypothetical protein
MTSKSTTSDEAHSRPSGSWWTGEDAPDFGDMEEQDLEFMQEEERMLDTAEPPSPMPECDVMEDAVEGHESNEGTVMSIDLDNPSVNTYGMVKARFELQCFKVNIPFCYARIVSGFDPCLHSHADLQHFYCDWKYWGTDKDGEAVRLPFITAWLRDSKKRVVERIVVDPTKQIKGVYNMWRGFKAETLPPVDAALVPGLISDITKHFSDVITLGNDEHTNFIHRYIASMVQYPWKKSQVALYLFGAEGCGKGILFEFIRFKILGEHCSFQTSKPESDLFGRFANGAVNRVLIQVDEVRNLHDYADQLKDLITNSTLNYEKKGRDTIVVDNLANLVFTSNNANSLTVSPNDRRFALFKCSSVHKDDYKYFNKLAAHLERPEVARAYYQYLMSLDLSEYPSSFQHQRPITDYYKEAQYNSIPVISRFFSSIVNAEFKESQIPAREFFKKFQLFHMNGNYKSPTTENSFGRAAGRINGITKKRLQCGIFYLFNHDAIKKHLMDINEYDADAEN